jgi:hypothetical protein
MTGVNHNTDWLLRAHIGIVYLILGGRDVSFGIGFTV